MTPIRVFNRTAHKAMWTWLAENPECTKQDWPGWEELGLSDKEKATMFDHFNCFACLAADYDSVGMDVDEGIDINEDICAACPLQWYGKNCSDVGHLFYVYSDAQCAENYELATHTALAIANLPVRESGNLITIVI